MNERKKKQMSYNEETFMLIDLFNSIYFDLNVFAYGILLAGELKDIGNALEEDQGVEVDPELLILSKDEYVKTLGGLIDFMLHKIDTLANINACSDKLSTWEELKEGLGKRYKKKKMVKPAYEDIVKRCNRFVLFDFMETAMIIEEVICKNGVTESVKKNLPPAFVDRAPILREYTNTNTALMLDLVVEMFDTTRRLMAMTNKEIYKRVADRGADNTA